jgi:hypothetical protein
MIRTLNPAKSPLKQKKLRLKKPEFPLRIEQESRPSPGGFFVDVVMVARALVCLNYSPSSTSPYGRSGRALMERFVMGIDTTSHAIRPEPVKACPERLSASSSRTRLFSERNGLRQAQPEQVEVLRSRRAALKTDNGRELAPAFTKAELMSSRQRSSSHRWRLKLHPHAALQ